MFGHKFTTHHTTIEKMKRFICLVCCLFSIANSKTLRGAINLRNAALLSKYENVNAGSAEKFSIFVATRDERNGSSLDAVYIIDRPGRFLNGRLSEVQPIAFDKLYNWPKEVQTFENVVAGIKTVMIPDGGDILGKLKGHIYIANITDINNIVSYDITSSPHLNDDVYYFYSDAFLKQLSPSGEKDILSCRTVFVSGVYNRSELVLLKRPEPGYEFSKPWRDTVLLQNACDSFLFPIQFPAPNSQKWDAVYAVGTYAKQLSVMWAESEDGTPGSWNDPSQLKMAAVDKGRKFYDLIRVDINNDKKLDVIVSIISEINGSIEIWEIPENDFRSIESYKKHVLDTFVPRSRAGSQAPGAMYVQHVTSKKIGKPWIFVAGSGDGRAYYYVPLSQDPLDWRYSKKVLDDYGAGEDVSGLQVQDLDGDGAVEVFVSLNVQGAVKIYSFSVDDE
ncbi:hypothetical protein HELRODRAFT_180273 [Helobdella robusta]|uniref:VCBS repeat-containing protein n=1 Tax=Helobdella robusta TaxID=6412 RepID=T1FFN6_HELRO|nr:hypothetical protein HELRODRAFT_180273 [Helobdella robusta]ESN94104.1 hypothetical protein HELRODRAFT_180273 [Helobdella robusta]